MEDELVKIKEKIESIEYLLIGQKDVLSFYEVSKYTGFSKSYLYKLTSSNSIPHCKPNGKMIFFDKKSLDAWLLRNKVKTLDEVEKEATDHLLNKMRGTK